MKHYSRAQKSLSLSSVHSDVSLSLSSVLSDASLSRSSVLSDASLSRSSAYYSKKKTKKNVFRVCKMVASIPFEKGGRR